VILSGHRATAHRFLRRDRAHYQMTVRVYRAQADAKVRRDAAAKAPGFTASEFGRALSAAFRKPEADPYPFRDGS
jgi:hypothetical protein